MGTQRLNARSTRRIERATGLTIIRAWGHGGFTFRFVTPEHQHGWYDSKTGKWGWDKVVFHYTSCHELFPDMDDAAQAPGVNST